MRLSRDTKGRFLKRHRHRSNPHRRRHRKPRAHRRGHRARHLRRRHARRNPHVILANPRALVVHKKHRPHRKHRRRGVHHLKRHHRRRHARRNPFGFRMAAWKHYAKLALSAGAGVFVSRMAKSAYQQYLRPTVLGAEAAGSNTARGILSDVLELVTMGAVPIFVERALLRRVHILDGHAFVIGGLAAAGHSALGMVVARVKPDWVGKYGFGAPAPSQYVEYVQSKDGKIYGRDTGGQWFLLGMGALTAGDEFGALTAGDEFGGFRAAGGYDRSGSFSGSEETEEDGAG